MRHLLARAHRPVLRQFAHSRLLLAFDYDGTLAPIVSDPGRAQLRPRTRRLLAAVAEHYPCVIITGRARADAIRRLGPVQAVEVIGNHGIEPWQISASGRRSVRRWHPLLTRRLAGLAGVTIEDKVHSLAIHYRNSPDKSRARAAIAAATATLRGARALRGKQVVNLLPAAAANKGSALRAARARFGCHAALYVGDDCTDEDAFALDRSHPILSVRIGRRRDSQAAYCLRNQREIDELLRLLLRFAQERPAAPPTQICCRPGITRDRASVARRPSHRAELTPPRVSASRPRTGSRSARRRA